MWDTSSHRTFSQEAIVIGSTHSLLFPKGTGEELKENKTESTGNAKTKGSTPAVTVLRDQGGGAVQ